MEKQQKIVGRRDAIHLNMQINVIITLHIDSNKRVQILKTIKLRDD